MNRKAAPSVDAELMGLFRVIARGDERGALRILEETPGLARAASSGGATRQESISYFLEAIAHHVYGGDTALHIAAAAYAAETVSRLVSIGADVRARNRRGSEPLHYAVDGGPGSSYWNPDAQSAVIELLIGAGADPNAENKDGVGPIHRAVRTRCAAAVRALLESGVNPLRRNKSGSTPLHLAVQDTGRSGAGSEAARAEQAEIIRLLLLHGASPLDKDARGKAVRDCVHADWIRALLAEKQS